MKSKELILVCLLASLSGPPKPGGLGGLYQILAIVAELSETNCAKKIAQV